MAQFVICLDIFSLNSTNKLTALLSNGIMMVLWMLHSLLFTLCTVGLIVVANANMSQAMLFWCLMEEHKFVTHLLRVSIVQRTGSGDKYDAWMAVEVQ